MGFVGSPGVDAHAFQLWLPVGRYDGWMGPHSDHHTAKRLDNRTWGPGPNNPSRRFRQ